MKARKKFVVHFNAAASMFIQHIAHVHCRAALIFVCLQQEKSPVYAFYVSSSAALCIFYHCLY